jgi:hypothetical protein
MAVKISVQPSGSGSQGRLQYPDSIGNALKPAITASAGNGWWFGFWLRTPDATWTSSQAIIGADGTAAAGSGGFGDVSEFGITQTATNGATNQLNFFGRGSSLGDIFAAVLTASQFTGMDNMSLSSDYLVLVMLWHDGTGWCLSRAVCPKNTTLPANNIQTVTSSSNTALNQFATQAQKGVNNIFKDHTASGVTTSGNARTRRGTAIEHVICVQGQFPLSGGTPDTSIITGLADGTYTFSSSAVINGGTVLDYRKLANSSDLSDYSGNGRVALEAWNGYSAGGSVTDESAIAPWSTAPVLTEHLNNFVWAGRSSGTATWSGTYPGSTSGSIQARVTSGGTAVSGFDWQTVVASPSGGTFSFSFSNIPEGGPYRVDVRWSGDTSAATSGSNDFYCGSVVWIWGQSQSNLLGTRGTATPTAGMKVMHMSCSNLSNTGVATPTLTKIVNSGDAGAAYTAIANQWHADTSGKPLMLVRIGYNGTGITDWLSDAKGLGSDTTTLWGDGTNPGTGLATFMAYHAKNQCDMVMFFQGTNDVANHSTYAARMEDLRNGSGGGGYSKNFDALISTSHIYGVVPHQRSDDGGNTKLMRQAQYNKAVSGSPWNFVCWLLDWLLDGDGSPHQNAAAEGNARGGTRIGRGLAKVLIDGSLDNTGPVASSIKFTDTTRNVIEITYNRNIKTAGGSAYSGSPITLPPRLFEISTDSGSTFGNPGSGFTAAITAANKVQLTKSSGSWSQSTTYVAHLWDTPFSGSAGVTGEYVGPLDVQTATADTTNGSTSINVTAISGTVAIGDTVVGSGIPSQATLSTAPGGTGTYVLSSAATATASGVSLTINRNESLMETNYLSKVITDTTTFDGSRGMPAAPILSPGTQVAEASASSSTVRPTGLSLALSLGL